MIGKAKILIVDDLPEKLVVYQSILEELNEELVFARSGAEALKLMLKDEFAVVLMDVNMPIMDGFETAALIRSRKRCAHTPIIFITAFADELHAVKGYSHGAVDYILAPVQPDVLRTKVRVFVELFRKTQQVREQGEALRQVQERAHQRQLWESNERLKLALEAGRMGACEWDLGARLLSWSPALETIFGFQPNEFTGTAEQLRSRLHPDDSDRVLKAMTDAVRSREEFRIEHRIIRNNGSVAWVELRGRVFLSDDGQPARMAGVCMDITDRKLAEAEIEEHRSKLEQLVGQRTRELELSHERLRLADRLASIGTLAAGLGHDMGNLLLPVRIRLSSLEKSVLQLTAMANGSTAAPSVIAETNHGKGAEEASHTGQKALEDIKAMQIASDYLRRLSQGLRLFALDPEDARVGDVTELPNWWLEVEPFYRSALPKHVELHADLQQSLPPIAMAPHTFTQIIYNLVQNAGDSMLDRTSGHVLINASSHADSSTVVISVTDSGPGMPIEIQQRCMEPFFTTKTRGISTGFGLAIVRGAVLKAGGSIELESHPGRGTSFRLSIPAAGSSGMGSQVESRAARIAFVNLQNKRLSAYVVSVLTGLGAQVRKEEWNPTVHANVLVTDFANGAKTQLEQYLRADASRRAVVFGDHPPAAPLDRAACLHSKSPPALIREALEQALAGHELCSGGATCQ